MSTELKRIGYIIAPPFSNSDNNCHCPTEEESAARTFEGNMKKPIQRGYEQTFRERNIYFFSNFRKWMDFE